MPTMFPQIPRHCLNEPRKLIFMEANDAVIKMCIKGSSPNMRHVTRTHMIHLHWLYAHLFTDVHIPLQYANTKQQIADIFTKGAFSVPTWNTLCNLLQLNNTHSKKLTL